MNWRRLRDSDCKGPIKLHLSCFIYLIVPILNISTPLGCVFSSSKMIYPYEYSLSIIHLLLLSEYPEDTINHALILQFLALHLTCKCKICKEPEEENTKVSKFKLSNFSFILILPFWILEQ